MHTSHLLSGESYTAQKNKCTVIQLSYPHLGYHSYGVGGEGGRETENILTIRHQSDFHSYLNLFNPINAFSYVLIIFLFL